MFEIAATLDRARLAQGLRSDYKLAIVMGVSHTAMNGYRKGKTLPDVRTIRKITDLTGDDPALMTAEIEYARAKDDETRSIWADIAQRLKLTTRTAHAGFATLASMAVVMVFAGLLVLAQSHAHQGLQAMVGGVTRFILCEISDHSRRVIPYPFISHVYRWCASVALRAIGGRHA